MNEIQLRSALTTLTRLAADFGCAVAYLRLCSRHALREVHDEARSERHIFPKQVCLGWSQSAASAEVHQLGATDQTKTQSQVERNDSARRDVLKMPCGLGQGQLLQSKLDKRPVPQHRPLPLRTKKRSERPIHGRA